MKGADRKRWELTVAEGQGSGREAVAERSPRQTLDPRNTKPQRGRMRATSVLGNAKSKDHQDASSRAAWHEGKAHVLTQGELFGESRTEVSRGHSSEESCRKTAGAKGQRNACKATQESVNRAEPAPTSADPSAESARLGTNPIRRDGAAISGGEGSGTAEITRPPGNQPAMQEAGMEAVVEASNWEVALSAVERNAGAPGPDGMRTKELREHLAKHGVGIKAKLRKEIPKPNGGIRPLSIPNVLDRFVQQLLLQVMQPLFEPHFSDASHGFRPGRGAHGAIEAAQRQAREGRDWVVDMDITAFFDRVNHDILMAQVSRVVRDKRMLQLIGRFLRAGIVLPGGCKVSSEQGTPQGGPLSPLLANIYLDKLDKEIERRGLRHVRYADDCNIYVSSQRAAQRVLEVISQWISRRLKLEVNAEKSGIGRVWERKFLGFILTTALLIATSPQAIAKFKDQVRAKWDARQSMTSGQLRDQWSDYQRGWWAYYGRVEEQRNMVQLSGWIRRHMRKCFWLRWHSASGRLAALTRLGIPPSRRKVAHSSRGAWRMGRNPVVQEALNNRTLKKYGLITPADLASRDKPRNVTNRRMRKTARPVVWEP